MNEEQMTERLQKLSPEKLVVVRAADLLAMLDIAASHRAMVPRLQALEQLLLRLQSEGVAQ